MLADAGMNAPRARDASFGLLLAERPDHRRFKFRERDDVIDFSELLWRKFNQFVDPDLEGMIIPNQGSDEQRLPFVLEQRFLHFEDHCAMGAWPQI